MENWNSSDVKSFLIEKGLREEIATDLEKQHVDGTVLQLFSVENEHQKLLRILPICAGDLLKIYAIVKNYEENKEQQNQLSVPEPLLDSPKQTFNQSPRKFGSDGGGVSYKTKFRLPPECGSFDLNPAIEFKSGQRKMNKNEFEKFLIERIAKFACACINQRCNGTIYFGVGDNKVLLLIFYLMLKFYRFIILLLGVF
jgi:hypothetical protein